MLPAALLTIRAAVRHVRNRGCNGVKITWAAIITTMDTRTDMDMTMGAAMGVPSRSAYC